jgi:uncharacterized protein YqeY
VSAAKVNSIDLRGSPRIGLVDSVGLQERMRGDLTAALKARDKAAVTALRTALAAVANAEAVPASDKYQEPVPGRSYEAARRELTADEVQAIVRAEAAERQSAIEEFESLGLHGDAERLRAELAVLGRYLR